jgi:hypothetical protein
LAAIRWTSSTPASAAISITSSRTSCRTSGWAIGGSGSERSSKAMVSRMFGRSSALSGSSSIGWAMARRIARSGCAIGSIGSGAYTTREPRGSFSNRTPSP